MKNDRLEIYTLCVVTVIIFSVKGFVGGRGWKLEKENINLLFIFNSIFMLT